MSISGAKFFGKAAELSTAVDATISLGLARCWAVEATAASKLIKFEVPETAELRAGFPTAYVYNVGATNAFTLAKADGTSIVSVPVGNVAAVALVNADGQGTWVTKVGPV